MKDWLNKIPFVKGSMACGICFWIKQDDDLEINAIVLEKKRDKLSVVTHASFKIFEDLIKQIPKNVPLYVSIDGKGILHKIVDVHDETPLIDMLLPNVEIKDFIVQDLSLNDNKKLVSVARRDKIEEFNTKLNDHGFDVLRIILGPFSLTDISDLLEDQPIINLPYYNIILNNQFLEGFERIENQTSKFSIELESDSIGYNYVIPFSNSINHFMGKSNLSINYPGIISQKEGFLYKQLFRLCGWVIMLFLFTSLLSNFLLFNAYWHKNQKLVSSIGIAKELLDQIERLELQVKANEDIMRLNFSFENPFFAYYIDRIAKTIPPEITLTNLCIAPQQKSKTRDEIFQFRKNIVLVYGYTYSSTYLDLWIKSLNVFNWVEEITIKNYNDNGLKQAGFELEINLKEKRNEGNKSV